MSFFVDNVGQNDIEKYSGSNSKHAQAVEISNSSEDEEPEIVKKILANISESDGKCTPITKNKSTVIKKSSKKYFDVDKECKNMSLGDKTKKGFRAVHKVVDSVMKETNNVDEILNKSVITPGFERLHQIPALERSESSLKMQRKKEREKTKGKKWYGLPATEVTEEVKHDLEVLQMRSVLDPKHFYKKNDMKVLPKYFQIGKVMDSPLDYYNSRCTKKERKKTLVDELLANAEFCKFNKRKYQEIIEEKQKTHYKAYRQAKKLKRKKKF